MTLDTGNSILPGASTGFLHYNGFTFPPAVKATVESQPVRDSTDRYTKYIKHTIRVECIVFPGCDTQVINEDGDVVDNQNAVFPSVISTTDGDPAQPGLYGYENLRRTITKSGGLLHFNGKGFGYDMSVNTNSNPDVAYGPVPRVLVWEPIGNNHAVRIVWAIDVHLAECGSTGTTPGSISEFVYESEYSINVVGATTRTVTGSLEISNLVVQSRGASAFSPDTWRDVINVHLPLGFERLSQSYKIAPNRKRLDFKIVDKQIESDYPRHRGMAVEDVSHTMKSVGQFAGPRWHVTVRAKFEVAMGFPKSLAYQTFLFYIKSRRAQSENAGNDGQDDPKAEPPPKNLVLPISITINDEMSGRGFSASMTWWVFVPKEANYMKKGGFFVKDVDDSSWGSYRQAFLQRNRGAWSPRGDAGMKDNAKNDIYTLCDASRQPSIRDTYLSPRPIGESHRVFSVSRPSEGSSYADFKASADLYENHSTLMVEPTGDAEKYTPVQQKAGSTNEGTGYPKQDTTMPTQAKGSRFSIHKRGKAQYVVKYSGSAVRVGYEVDKPNLMKYSSNLSVAGGQIIPVGAWKFSQKRINGVEGIPVYAASWTQYYALDGVPASRLKQEDGMLGFMT